jgi:hypothetical protein
MRKPTNLLGTTTTARTFYSRFIHPIAVVLYSFVASSTCVEGQNNEENTDDDDLATDIVESFAGLGPYLIVASLLIFMMHYIFHPLYMTRNLMKVDYLQHGVAVMGQALDCQEKQQQQQDATSESASSSSSSSYLVEVLYEAQEHKFGYNDRLKYRNPTAFETKRLVRRFQFTRPVTVGDVVPVLLPRGNGTQMNTRSGCPREVVERILGEQNQKLQHWFWILVLGILSIIILIAQAIQVVHYRQQQQQQEQQQDQDDDTDNNIHVHPAWHGYVAILVAIVVAEALSFLFSVDAFLKKKVKTWDACRPMVSSYEQEQRQRREAQEAEEKRRQQRGYDNPFAIPLNEFAGHARATGRQTV